MPPPSRGVGQSALDWAAAVGALPDAARARRAARRSGGGRAEPPTTPPPAPSLPRAAAGAAAQPCQLRELPWNFPGARRRRPHLTEHLQVVLVLVQIQHLGLQQGGGAAAARDGLGIPRALPAGAPGWEARSARLRRPALALHPESARPAGRRCQPGSPEPAHWLPRVLRLPDRPRSSPSPAAQTRKRRGERGSGARPPSSLGPARGAGVGLSSCGWGRKGPPAAGRKPGRKLEEGVRAAARRGFPRGRGSGQKRLGEEPPRGWKAADPSRRGKSQ